MTKYTYKSIIENGSGLFIDSAKLIDKTAVGVVIRSDGMKVWRGRSWRADKAGMKRARLEANSAVGRFRQYYSLQGSCWHDEQLAEGDAKRVRNAIELARVRLLRSRAQELFDALMMLPAARAGVRRNVSAEVREAEAKARDEAKAKNKRNRDAAKRDAARRLEKMRAGA